MKEIPIFSTTSFIYRDTRVMNVFKLMHLFDEIELLYFESKRGYDKIDKNELTLLKKLNVTYCPHLPYDRNLNNKDDFEIIEEFVSKLSKLSVSYFFLHADRNEYDSLNLLVNKYPKILVENVNDIKIFDDLIDSKIDYCVDIGHLIKMGEDVVNIVKKYEKKIKYFHLHGVKNGVDHQNINFLDKRILLYVLDFAIEKRIGISLEVFGINKLLESLNYLLEVFEKHGYTYHRWSKEW